MDSLDDLTENSSGKGGFFKHVFNFEDDTKSDILNIIQYALIAIIPIVIMNKMMQRFVPEADEDKDSYQIVAEILGQIIVMFLLMFIIHRIITYIPTYSGVKYMKLNITNIILAMLVIILSLQTKLGEKVSILVDRLIDLWEGPKKGKKGNVKVSQPISQNQMTQNYALNSMGSTSISSLPMSQPTQSNPDFNSMYQQSNTPLVAAATPGVESFVPVAANETGVGAFGSAFGW